MKKYLLLVSFFLVAAYCHALTYSVEIKDTTRYAIVDELPVFPGNDSALVVFISKRLVYPTAALERNLVLASESVSFLVTDSGDVKNIKVTVGSVGVPELDAELVRVLKLMPRWKPGMLNGKTVNVDYMMGFFILYNPADKTIKITLLDISRKNNYKTKAENAYASGVQKSQFGDMRGAIADFTEALKYNPEDIDALYNRGILKFKIGDRTGACADWNAIKSLGKPDADDLLKKYCGG
jgi:tetratricopeptide (TPR) repeat protein